MGKAYGSMVVYVTKGSEAMRLLQGQYFHVQENQPTPGFSNHGIVPHNVTGVKD